MNSDNSAAAPSVRDRSQWRKIKSVKRIMECAAYDGNKWSILEVTSGKASSALCSLFGANSWCVKNRMDAVRYLPLYFFMTTGSSGKLSLLACYSDHDKVLSDRANKDMFETDHKTFKSLARMMLSARPRAKVMASFVAKAQRDIRDIFPARRGTKERKIMTDTLIDLAAYCI
jgi:hypothetical protein